jgi:LacI family transcriptional regulator
MTRRTPTLGDVAKLAGVSLATASRSLNGVRHVSPELRERALAAARELGYAPNPHARALVHAADGVVGVLVHDVSDPYFAQIVRGILVAADAAEVFVLLCNTYRNPERELAYVSHFRARRARGLVLAGSGLEDREYGARLAEELARFEAAGGQVALIGRHYAPGDAVVPDNVGGAFALAQSLVGLGHRTIGVIAGPKLLTTRDRLAGFRAGLAEAGAALPDQNVVSGDFTRDGGFRGAHELLDRIRGLTAIFALNDAMAIGALAALRDRGVPVPDQVSLCGFGDIPIVQDILPALSTVRVPMVEMGVRALTMATEPRGDDIRVEQLPTQVVLRASTGPVELR